MIRKTVHEIKQARQTLNAKKNCFVILVGMNLYAQLTTKNVLALCFLGAVALTIAAFILEYGFAAEPCQMCWWQRYIHWGVGLVALVGYVLYGRVSSAWALGGIAFLGLGGTFIAAWQALAQYQILSAPSGCTSSNEPLALNSGELMASLQSLSAALAPACDQVDFTIFGLTLAMWNIPVMLGFTLLAIAAMLMKRK